MNPPRPGCPITLCTCLDSDPYDCYGSRFPSAPITHPACSCPCHADQLERSETVETLPSPARARQMPRLLPRSADSAVSLEDCRPGGDSPAVRQVPLLGR